MSKKRLGERQAVSKEVLRADRTSGGSGGGTHDRLGSLFLKQRVRGSGGHDKITRWVLWEVVRVEGGCGWIEKRSITVGGRERVWTADVIDIVRVGTQFSLGLMRLSSTKIARGVGETGYRRAAQIESRSLSSRASFARSLTSASPSAFMIEEHLITILGSAVQAAVGEVNLEGEEVQVPKAEALTALVPEGEEVERRNTTRAS